MPNGTLIKQIINKYHPVKWDVLLFICVVQTRHSATVGLSIYALNLESKSNPEAWLDIAERSVCVLTSFFNSSFPRKQAVLDTIDSGLCCNGRAAAKRRWIIQFINTRRLWAIPHGSTDLAELIAFLDSRYLKNNILKYVECVHNRHPPRDMITYNSFCQLILEGRLKGWHTIGCSK